MSVHCCAMAKQTYKTEHPSISFNLNQPWSKNHQFTMSLEHLVKSFTFERLLESNTQTKHIALLGSINSQPAIIRLERAHYNLDAISTLTSATIQDIINTGSNDIYQWGLGTTASTLPDNADVKINIIYPATETHINKYSHQEYHVVSETPEMYQKYVVPFIETQIGDRLQWVRNILFEGAEAERVVYRDEAEDGFVLVPDMKWDGINVDQLYLTAIVNRGTQIKSVRDLNIGHAEWLKAMALKIRTVVVEKYQDIKPDQLRLFVHYHPSYYHLHIHCVIVSHPGLGDGIGAGKAILLEEVIDQLQWLGEEGFKKKTMTYTLGENHKLWMILKDHI